MTIHKKGQAHWEGDIKRGKGTVSTESGVLNQQPYGFNTVSYTHLTLPTT